MNEHQRVEREVEELIAGAGPRPAVPAEDAATIQAAARQEWRRMVERERRGRRRLRRRRRMALAAGVLVAVAAGWWWIGRPAPSAPPIVAAVELLSGAARAQPPDAGAPPVELAVGGELASGALVETGGWAEGRPAGVALRLAGGESLRLAADTSVRLVSARRFELRRGTLYVDSGTPATPGVEVVTALGTVRDIGTQFEVRLSEGDAAMRVRVREGECSLEAGGERHLAGRGEQLSLLGDGTVARAPVDPYGPEWAWVVAAAPGIETDGRSLDTVLAWAARETGRELRYADEALAAEATEIIVRGSAEGFTPDETLATVVAGSGVRHEVENGTILILR